MKKQQRQHKHLHQHNRNGTGTGVSPQSPNRAQQRILPQDRVQP